MWAPLEAARRWFNALALSAPGAPAMLIGSFDEVTERSVVLWRPQELADSILQERFTLGFPPARWVVLAIGDSSAIERVRDAVRRLQAKVTRSSPDPSANPDALMLPPVATIGEWKQEDQEVMAVSCSPKAVSSLMDAVWRVQVDLSAAGKPLVAFETNPPRIAEAEQKDTI